jgi:hypothetical protein
MYRKVPTVDRTRKVLPSQAGMNYMYKYNTNTVATVYRMMESWNELERLYKKTKPWKKKTKPWNWKKIERNFSLEKKQKKKKTL